MGLQHYFLAILSFPRAYLKNDVTMFFLYCNMKLEILSKGALH